MPIPRLQKIGNCSVAWTEIADGTIRIKADGPTRDERIAAQRSVQAQFEHEGFVRLGDWSDVMDKAKRLVQTGAVQLIRNAANKVVGMVNGDHGTYQTEINRDDPTNPNALSGSSCQCDWGNFQNTPRTRIWEKYQDRVCSHILATNWLAQSVPTDESRSPGDFGGSGQMSLPMSTGPMVPSSQMPLMRQVNAPGGAMYGQPQIPGQAPAPPAPLPPAPVDLLPQFPLDPSLMPEVNPASIPGGRPGPTPTNPNQFPGGTFSSWSWGRQADIIPGMDFANGDVVQLKNEDQGTAVGDHPDRGAGSLVRIPKNSIGEVLGVDPVSKMINVMYTGPQRDNRQLEPWGTVAWHWPSDVQRRDDLRGQINPHIRRRVPRL